EIVLGRIDVGGAAGRHLARELARVDLDGIFAAFDRQAHPEALGVDQVRLRGKAHQLHLMTAEQQLGGQPRPVGRAHDQDVVSRRHSEPPPRGGGRRRAFILLVPAMLFGPPSPRNPDRHGTGGRGAYARPVRGELAVRPSALPTADAIGSLSREEKEPTGTIVRPVLCRGGGYEEVPPPAARAAAAPGGAAHGWPGRRRGVRRRRAWGGSGLGRCRLRGGLGLRLRLFRGALLRYDALFLTGRRGFFPRLPFLRLRLRFLR